MKVLPLGLALTGLIAATAAFAQMPPPGNAPPPPPPHGDHPPPPPRGTVLHIDRNIDKGFRFDLRCDERETARACADIALQVLDKLTAAGPK